jgi:hypothetical protein
VQTLLQGPMLQGPMLQRPALGLWLGAELELCASGAYLPAGDGARGDARPGFFATELTFATDASCATLAAAGAFGPTWPALGSSACWCR